MPEVTVDVAQLYAGTAKLSDLDSYIQRARELAGEGKEIVLTGAAPVWLYLKIAHALHGKARKLIYKSPSLIDETNPYGVVMIFDHSPY